MTDDTDDLGRLIVKVAGTIARDDDNDCPWTGQAGKLADAIASVLDAFAVLIPDSDESDD